MKKLYAEGDSSSPFSRLPDELVLQILNKIIDLKTLCTCKLVSKRFSSIVVQIDSVSLTVSSEFDLNGCNGVLAISSRLDSFLVARKSIWRFTRLKSLYIHLPFNGGIDNNNNTDYFNFKWKIKVSNRVDSFVFVSPNSIYNTNSNTLLNGVSESSLQNEEEENAKFSLEKFIISLNCFKDAVSRLMLLGWTDDFLFLEYVSIMDSGKWGTVCFNSSGKIYQVRDFVRSKDVVQKLNLLDSPDCISWCYVPLLKLPVSGYIMKGVTMILIVRDDLPDDSIINIDVDKEDGFEQDKEEAAYREAILEIFKKHRGSIERVPLV